MRSKTFCVLPWVHAATLPDGNVQLCCVSGGGSGVNLNEHTLADYWNSEYVKDARRRMLAGEEVKACQHCYNEEAHGYRSHRIVENEVWHKRCGEEPMRQLISRTAADGTLDAALQQVDLRLGNTCNMQCIMCQPRESSRWLPAAKKLSEICQDAELKREFSVRSTLDASRFEWYRNVEFWSNLKTFLPHVKEIILAGGEPFLIAEQFAFVKLCCELGEAHHIRLRYHTNGTVFPEEMPGYWEQFERVHFLVSLDGIDEVANYVRYPSPWTEIEDNVRCLDNLGANTVTSFLFTTHALNVYRIPEVCDWADRGGFQGRRYFSHIQDYVSLSLVHRPAYLNVRVLPNRYKLAVNDKLEAYMRTRMDGQRADKLAGILSYMHGADCSRSLPTLVEYTEMLDATRGTGFAETFPELAPYWRRHEGRATESSCGSTKELK
ncbi:MAG: twitch domain-containing radical SAM protein [Acidobacteriota bacterium]